MRKTIVELSIVVEGVNHGAQELAETHATHLGVKCRPDNPVFGGNDNPGWWGDFSLERNAIPPQDERGGVASLVVLF